MARIDWVVMCDHAFLDRQDRLCLIGIVRRLSAPRLPLALNQVMLVARLVDIQQIDEIAISVAILTPSGFCTSPKNSDYLAVEMAGEYL